MAKDRYERRHRRTWRNPEAVAFMASADFDAVPPLAEAMGLGGDDPKWDDQDLWLPCAVCRETAVNAGQGYDTCEGCLAKQ